MAEIFKRKKWIRYGECKRCGQCCYMKNLVTAGALQFRIDPKLKEFLESERGSEVKCIHLSYDSEGRAQCDVYGTSRRPPSCKDHPSSPLSITRGCTAFLFEEVKGEE